MTWTMRTWMGVIAGLTLLFSTGPAAGDGLASMQPGSDNGADVIFGGRCGQGWIDISGNSTPFFPTGEGIILVPLQGSVKVTTPPSAGRLNFNCRGTLPLGAQVLAVDFITGLEIQATLATMDELCDVISDTWPDACRGKNGPFLSKFETVGAECTSSDGIETFFTKDWVSVTTRSGASTLNCHFDLDE